MSLNPSGTVGRTDEKDTDADAPDELALVLDLEHDTGLTWWDHWGDCSDDREPIVRETLAGVDDCEQCDETAPVYRVSCAVGGALVCQDCLAGHEWVEEVRPVGE